MQTWYVYLLECADGTYYCGATTDVERRLGQHNAGTAARYTRCRLPVTLRTFATCTEGRSEALKLEAATKKVARNQKIHFLDKYQPK